MVHSAVTVNRRSAVLDVFSFAFKTGTVVFGPCTDVWLADTVILSAGRFEPADARLANNAMASAAAITTGTLRTNFLIVPPCPPPGRRETSSTGYSTCSTSPPRVLRGHGFRTNLGVCREKGPRRQAKLLCSCTEQPPTPG